MGGNPVSEDILSVLQSKLHTFSKGQRAIARYISGSYDKAAFMTANKLGKLVGVSESTVVRFAMELGYDGYPSMQKAMQEMVLNRLTSVQRIGVTNDRIGNQDVVSMVVQEDIDRLRQTSETLDRTAFHWAVKMLMSARRIYVLGVRATAPLANFLGYYLNYMFENVHVINTSGTSDMFEKLVGIGPEDAVVSFSFPRYSTAILKGTQFCRSVGAKVIGITNSAVSPLAECCDQVLIAKSDMASLVDSLVAPMSVVNALIVALAAEKEQTIAKTFDTLERVWEEYNVYEKRTDRS